MCHKYVAQVCALHTYVCKLQRNIAEGKLKCVRQWIMKSSEWAQKEQMHSQFSRFKGKFFWPLATLTDVVIEQQFYFQVI